MAICTSPEVSRGDGKGAGNTSLDGSTESGFEEIVLEDVVEVIKVKVNW